VTVAAKSEQFTAGETGEGQFLFEETEGIWQEKIVRKISSPSSIAGVPCFKIIV